MTIELTDEQLSIIRMALAIWAEQLATESREYTCSSIVEQRLRLAREVLRLLSTTAIPQQK